MIDISFSQANLEYFLIILVRIASFFATAPFFSQANTPIRIKLGLSVFVAYILYQVLPPQTLEYATVIDYALLVVKESITGLLIGFAAYVCQMIIIFSGRIMDMEIGLAMAQVFDPTTRQQTGLTGTFYSYMILLLMLLSDMHIFLLNAIVDSYEWIPLGGVKIADSLYETVVDFLGDYFIIGFRIILPVFAVMLILSCVLGIMAKVAPQMNMFAVGMQLKVLLGLLIIFLTVQLMPVLANFIFDTMKRIVIEVMRGMA